jgi:hypothetical protein
MQLCYKRSDWLLLRSGFAATNGGPHHKDDYFRAKKRRKHLIKLIDKPQSNDW